MEVLDSRRLTGPNRFWDLPGAVIDLQPAGKGEPAPADDAARFVEAWSCWARRMLDAVGWASQKTTHRVFENGTSVVLSAPIDALYAATEINEWAVAAALLELAGESEPDLERASERLRETIEEECNPALLELSEVAARKGMLFLSDDDFASVGSGKGSKVWAVAELPDLSSIEWSSVANVPVAAITGTNGKSTTVRLLAAMATAAGLTPGVSSTDWLRVGEETIDVGDYSGPGGARTILRDARVDVALLETARGGLNRRGLAVPSLDVAAVTNIGADHLGEHGSTSLEDLADVKFAITRVARHLVLQLGDPLLAAHGREVLHEKEGAAAVTWCSLDESSPSLAAHVDSGGTACVLREKALVLIRDGASSEIAVLEEVPCTLGGAARHNVANALSAIGVANALGWPITAMREGLMVFGTKPSDNPGRLNRFALGELDVLVDFAHNPNGVEALLELSRELDPQRCLVVLGQAGDRDDRAIRELAGVVAPYRPDRILLKELTEYLRGREAGEVPDLMERELLRTGVDEATIERVRSELDALRRSLEWGRAGDLILMITHSDRDRVLESLTKLGREGWQPQQPLPDWL